MINQRGSLMRRKILQRTYALLALVVVFFSFLFGTVYRAQAETSVISYDERSIYEDLNDLGLAPALYVQDSGKSPQALAFMEYCYSDNGFISQEYYGLYVYMYNPSGKAVKTSGNTVTMATAFEGDKVKSYDSIPLELLDKTENNLLLKFKVQNAYGRFYSLAKAYASGNEAKERRYDVVGVQLTHQESEDTTYATSFYFSGFSAGCGSNVNSPSTLASRSEGFETIKLNVGHSNFRTMAFNDDNVCDEINTVYFSLPEDYYENYGGLQKIKAEWEEYRTTPIFVTNEQAAYYALEDWLCEDIGNREDELTYRVLWEKYLSLGSTVDNNYAFKKAYNRLTGGSTNASLVPNNYYWANEVFAPFVEDNIEDITRLAWLFLRTDVDFEELEDWHVSAEEIESYVKTMSAKYESLGENNVGSNNYLSYLFEDSIDADRVEYLDENNDGDNQTATRGKITQEIDAGDDGKLLFEKDKSWWDKLAFWKTDEDFQYNEYYSPIVSLTKDDIAGLDAASFASRYYLNIKDVEGTNGIFAQCQKAIQAGNRFVLFRFAKTDYYSSKAYFDSEENDAFTSCDGYVAQETVFLDFDIISLTFRDESGKETVISVVSNPIDIFNGTDANPDIFDGDDGDDLLDRLKKWLNDLKNRFNDVTSSIKRVIAIIIGVILVAIVIRIVRDIIGHKRE